MAMAEDAYPVQLELDAPLEVARWRPLVHWLLAIPHFLVVYVLQLASGVLTFIAFFAILFTARIPEGIFNFIVAVHRYQWRVTTYLFFMREPYPPFSVAPSATDPGTDPARLSTAYPERLSRLLIFVKWLLVLPHLLVLFVLSIGAFVALVGGFFAVLFTGRWPQGLRDFLIGLHRWGTRVQAYAGLLTDRYPPFSLNA
jgi:hypothetical protein